MPKTGQGDVPAATRFTSKEDTELTHAVELLFGAYQTTDMQFNIGRTTGWPQRGVDLIDPQTRERLFVARTSSPEAEEILNRRLGNRMLEKTLDAGPDISELPVSVYHVEQGTELLVKVFRHSPYRTEYMNHVAQRAGRLVRQVAALDRGLFGLTPDALALNNNQEEDASLSLIPPFAEPETRDPQTPAEFAAGLVPNEYRHAFIVGYREGLTREG